MQPNRIIATICYGILAAGAAMTGCQLMKLSKYATSQFFNIGTDWQTLAPSVQEMIGCLIGTRGLGLFVIGLLMAATLAGPFRKGRPGSRWALPLLSLTGLSLLTEVISGLDLMPGELAPLAPVIPAACIALAGCLFSYLDGPFEQMHQIDITPVITPAYERR